MLFRKLIPDDEDILYEYFQNLSPATKSRYGPHDFDKVTVRSLCNNSDKNLFCYVAIDENFKIIAYSVLKKGYLDYEIPRLSKYPISLDYDHDYTYAPSVADAYQSKGFGTQMLNFILDDLRKKNAIKLVLWGGVQESNEKAVKFYLKNGFRILGKFNHKGWNLDMVKNIQD